MGSPIHTFIESGPIFRRNIAKNLCSRGFAKAADSPSETVQKTQFLGAHYLTISWFLHGRSSRRGPRYQILDSLGSRAKRDTLPQMPGASRHDFDWYQSYQL